MNKSLKRKEGFVLDETGRDSIIILFREFPTNGFIGLVYNSEGTENN